MKYWIVWLLVIAFIVLTFFGVKKLIGSNDSITRVYDDLILKYATKYNLDPKMIKAIAMHESSLGQDSRVKNGLVSRDGKTFGLMQIKLSVAQHYIPGITLNDLMTNPEKGLDAACAYLADLKKKFNGDVKKIIISYNQGETHTKKGEDFSGNYFSVIQKNIQLIG